MDGSGLRSAVKRSTHNDLDLSRCWGVVGGGMSWWCCSNSLFFTRSPRNLFINFTSKHSMVVSTLPSTIVPAPKTAEFLRIWRSILPDFNGTFSIFKICCDYFSLSQVRFDFYIIIRKHISGTQTHTQTQNINTTHKMLSRTENTVNFFWDIFFSLIHLIDTRWHFFFLSFCCLFIIKRTLR